MKPANEDLLAELVAHVGRADVVADVHAVYAELAEAASSAGGVCNRSGRCCRFAEFGHCLYVTTPELVHFLTHIQADPPPPDSPIHRALAALPEADPGEFCPFQVEGLCGARPIRPLGCRLYFCQPEGQQLLRSVYESYQGRMRQICQTRSLPYGYVEWTGALAHMVSAGIIIPCSVDA